MSSSTIRAWSFWVVLCCSASASAFEESVRRESVDAGVHVPVLTKAPELLDFVEATYPEEAQQAGLSASVRLLVTLDAQGAVSNAQVAEPVGHGFDEAALQAVRRFRFSPAEVDGVPAPVQIEYVYHFALKPPPVDEATPPPEPPKAVLKGTVLERGSRKRVQSATVRCGDEAEATEVLSGADGTFSLEVVPGACEVRVLASGYQLFQTREELAPGETAEVVYHLLPRAIGFETVVRGTRDKKEVVRRTLERQELQKIPGTFGDPVRVLQNFPGVARAPFLSGALIVRGASPNQTLTLLDGVELPLLYHLGGGPSVINGEFLDRIDFYPGGFGARYGRAIGGAVDVATRKGASDTLHGSVKVDLQDSAFFLEAPVAPGVSVAGAARRSYVDALIPLVLPPREDGGTLLVLPVYWDYQVRVDVGARRGKTDDTGASSYSVMAFGSDDQLKVVATGSGLDRDVSVDAHTVFHRVIGGWTHRGASYTSVLTPYAGYDLASFDFGVTQFRADQYALGLREDLTFDVKPWLTLRLGSDVKFEAIHGSAELPVVSGAQYVPFPGAEPEAEVQRFERQLESFDGALYAEADFRAGPLTVTPGVRVSHFFANRQSRRAGEPRLWVRYALTQATQLKGSVGLYQQAPDATELEPAPLGSDKLRHEKAFQSSVGVEHRFSDVLSLDVTGYYNRRFDLTVSPGPITVNDDGSVLRERLGNRATGRAYGAEVMLRHDITRNFFGWVAYTLNRSETRAWFQDGYTLTGEDQTHILTLVGSYRLGNGWELGARFRYVTGRPTTPLQHQTDLYNVDANRFSPTFGEARSARLRPFQQLDLRVDKSFLFESWTLSVYLDVQNVYNASNVEATFYDYRYRESFDVPGIPFLPVLGVKGTF